MAMDELVVGFRYKILDEVKVKIDSALERAVKRTKELEKQGKKTYSALKNEMAKFTEMQEKSNKSSNRLMATLKAIGAVILTTATYKKAVTSYSDLIETQNKFNQVYKEHSLEANLWAERYSEDMGMSVKVTKEAMGDIQNLFTGFGMGRKEAMDLSKQIISLGNDLDSFNNLSSRGVNVQKTMLSALMGESEAGKTLGASLLEPQLKIAALALGYKTYNTKMAETEKIRIRLKAIEMQSKDAIGDVARNLDTEVAKRRRLNAEIETLYLNLGKELMPVQMELLKVSIQTIQKINENKEAFNAVGGAIKTVITNGMDFITFLGGSGTESKVTRAALELLIEGYLAYNLVVGTATAITKIHNFFVGESSTRATLMSAGAIIKNTAVKIANTTATVAQNIAIGIGNGISKTFAIVTNLSATAQWAFNAALSANPIGLVVGGLILLGGAMYMAYKKSETFRNIVGAVFKGLKIMFDWITGKTVFNFFKSLFMGDSKKEIILTEKKAIEQVNTEKSDSKTKNTIEMIDKRNDIPKYAKGTKHAIGGLSLVGEEGPELVDLPKGSKVFDAARTNKIIKGNNAKYNTFNNYNTSSMENTTNDNKSMTNKVINNEYKRINNENSIIKNKMESILNEDNSINNSKTINDIKNYSTIRELISKEKSTETKIIPNFIKPSYQKVEEREDKKSTKKDKGYSVMIEGSKYEFNFSGTINNFEDIKEKLERWLDKREMRRKQKLTDLLGGA